MNTPKRLLTAGGGLLASLQGYVPLVRPIRLPVREGLFEGVTYERRFVETPRAQLIHLVSLDLTRSPLRPFVTPGDKSAGLEVRAATTSSFLKRYGLSLAINGSFYARGSGKGPQEDPPTEGEPMDVMGEVISDGIRWSKPASTAPVLCFAKDATASIWPSTCPPQTAQGLSGHWMLVKDGKAVGNVDRKPEPRTAVGIAEGGRKLWLIVIDGRQPGYSEGATLPDLEALSLSLGVTDALNLDGGGSSTLVISSWLGARVLNVPIHTRVPMRERPVANHLGFRLEK